MAAIAPIAIADGKTPTAATHNFKPKASDPVATYRRDEVAGQPAIAWESISIKVKTAAANQDQNIIDIDLSIPVLEQVTGGTSSGYVAAPRVAHTMKAKVSFYVSNRSDIDGRKDLRVMLSNLLKHQAVIDAVDSFEKPY